MAQEGNVSGTGRPSSLDHVAIAVTDLEEAIRWYRDGLGFDLVERRTTRGAKTSMVSAVMSSGGAIIVLVQGCEPASQVSRFVEKFGAGVQHLAISVTDLDATMKRLGKVGGAADIDIIEGDGIRQVFLRRDDGSGVRIELIERRGGTFNDASVEKLFRAFEKKDLC
ncbi:MAG: VOC family protein [Hyphomicrobiales bacterium]